MPTLEEEISRRRTFAIISHPDAGKTTLTEKFLLYGGAIAQAGEVKGKRAKAATSDWMEIEKQRGISVTSSVMQFQHDGFCINILDTPGHQDFSEDTYRTLMAAEREIVEEAYAGDIIGVFDPGLFAIGDTITVPGKKFRYSGIPTFEPEHFMRVSPKDTMKRKQFIKGTEQIAQEGAIQIFKIPGAGLEEVIVGVVGTLQFDVFEYRMKNEYNVDLRMTSLPYDHLRLIESMDCHPDEIVLCTGAAVLQDFRDRYLLAFDGEWSVGFLTKHNPGLVLADTLSV